MPADKVTDASGVVRLQGTITGPDLGDVLYVQDADPGAVGAGKLWLNTTDPGHGVPATARPLLVRDAANSAWDEVVAVHRDGSGVVRGFLTFADGAAVMEVVDATGSADLEEYFQGGADPYWWMFAFGSAGTAYIKLGETGMLGHGTLAIQGATVGQESWGITTQGAEAFAKIATPSAPGTSQRIHWYDDTAGAPKLRFQQKDSAGTLFSGINEVASPITSGALSTLSLSSGTGAQVIVARAAETFTPVTFNPTAGAAATCAIALSPDNVTYSALGTETEPAGVAFDGTIHVLRVRVPAGWYIKLTVVNATIGTTTYY